MDMGERIVVGFLMIVFLLAAGATGAKWGFNSAYENSSKALCYPQALLEMTYDDKAVTAQCSDRTVIFSTQTGVVTSQKN